jgi:hypothetical protein
MSNYNPILLTHYEAASIKWSADEHNAEYNRCYPMVVTPDFAENVSDIDMWKDYQYEMYESIPYDDWLKHNTHETAMSVIDAIQSRFNQDYDEEYSSYDRATIVAQEYNHMSDAMRNNIQEMLALAAWRPDAVLWADDKIFNQNFVEQALRHNPLVFAMLPEQLQQNEKVIGIYADVLYGDGYKQHPSCNFNAHEEAVQSMEEFYGKDTMSPGLWEELYEYDQEFEEAVEEEERKIATPDSNFLLSPKCDAEKLYTLTGYEKVMSQVMLNPAAHPISFDKHDNPQSDRALSYVATCLTRLPHDKCIEIDIKIYTQEDNKEKIKQQASKNPSARAYLAEFCLAHQLPPEPEWKKEYDLLQRGVNLETVLTLPDMTDRINSLPWVANYCDEVLDLMTKIPTEDVKQLLDVNQFWIKVGENLAEAKMDGHQEAVHDIEKCIEGNSPLHKNIQEAVNFGSEKKIAEITQDSYERDEW